MTDTLKQAISRLRAHNEWRRGADTEMCSPAQLGEDIEAVCAYAERMEKALARVAHHGWPAVREGDDKWTRCLVAIQEIAINGMSAVEASKRGK